MCPVIRLASDMVRDSRQAGPQWRFREERLAGLFSRHAGQGSSTLTPALEARILEWTLKRTPPDGATQWSTRRLGTQLQVSHMMVARVWAKHGLKPQRLDRYMASDDRTLSRRPPTSLDCI